VGGVYQAAGAFAWLLHFLLLIDSELLRLLNYTLLKVVIHFEFVFGAPIITFINLLKFAFK